MQLPEQLGEVDHMFCDKTGTLTQNDLDVKCISVNGKVSSGETREDISQLMTKQCTDGTDVEALIQCFCLCNEMRVTVNEQTGLNEYDGESQDELLLLKLSQAGSQFELVKRDQFSITLL